MLKCWYHSVDLDGQCSGAIVKYALPEVALYPIDYGVEFPWDEVCEDDIVYMVDFSLSPFTDMVKLADKVSKFVWIDHHKTAIKAYNDYTVDNRAHFTAITKEGIGACQLVWEYFLPNRSVPYAVKLLAQADVGNWENAQTLPFKYGMSGRGSDPEDSIWPSLFSDSLSVGGIANDGRIIRAFIRQQDADVAKEIAFETEFDGLRLIAANRAKPNSGFLFSVYDQEKHDAMACFYWKKGTWLMDLYTKREDLDLGAFCKERGGGGHKRAAGMPLSLQTVKELVTNTLKSL